MDVHLSSLNIALTLNRMAEQNRLAETYEASECMDRAAAILQAHMILKELCTEELAEECRTSMAENAFEIGQTIHQLAESGKAILCCNESDMFAPWVSIPMASAFTLVALPA